MLSIALVSYLTTAVIIYFSLSRASIIGLVDRPGAHKQHVDEVPVVGGIAIFCGFTLSLLCGDTPQYFWVGFVIPAVGLLVVGIIDDLFLISPQIRFVSEIVAGTVMTIGGGIAVYDLGALVSPDSVVSTGVLSVPFTIICLVGLTNAFNMSDGIDGLTSVYVLAALFGLGIVAYVGGNFGSVQFIILLVLSVIAFMGFNIRFPWRKRAVVFLGDAGSMFLGFSITWLTVSLSQGEDKVMTPVTALWFVSLPLFDMTATMLRRIFRRKSPFLADREHLHHVFLLAGYSVNQTVIFLGVLALISAGIGIAGLYLGVAQHIMFFVFLGLFGLYFTFTLRVWSVMRFFGRSICRRRSGVSCRRKEGDRRRATVPPGDFGVSLERRLGGDRRLSVFDRRQRLPKKRFTELVSCDVVPEFVCRFLYAAKELIIINRKKYSRKAV